MSALAATLAVIDEDGHEAVSIRRLARELNYSRSGLAYRIGSMPELELEVFSAVAGQLLHAIVGTGPVRADDPAWTRASALRALAWHDEYPNRAHFLLAAQVSDDMRCPTMGALLSAAAGRPVQVNGVAVSYLLASFRLMLEIIRLFGDRERALDAVTRHCTQTWQTLVEASGQPVAA